MSLCVKKAFKHDACQQKLVSTYTQMGKQADLQGLNIKFQLFRLYPFVCFEQDYILNKNKKKIKVIFSPSQIATTNAHVNFSSQNTQREELA